MAGNNAEFQNINAPFTEIISILKRYKNVSEGFPTLAYNSEELKIMNQHIDNAVDILLHGLQDLGNLVSVVAQDKRQLNDDLNNIGFFISAICNLTEALNTLRSDATNVLMQR